MHIDHQLLVAVFITMTYSTAPANCHADEFPLREHPRLYFTESDLPRLRAQRETSEVHQRIWQNLLRWADWCAAQPMRTQWIAPQSEDPQFENLYDRFYAAMHDMAIIEHLAFAAALSDATPNPYLEPAKQWTLSAARVWKQETNAPADASKAYAVLRVMKALAVSYDLLYHDFTEAERTEIRAAITPVCESYYQFFRTTLTGDDGYNQHHGSVDAPPLGVAALALLGEVDQADAWLDQVIEKHVEVLLPGALTPSGTNSQSSNFWASSLQYRIFFLDALQRVTGRNLVLEFPRAYPGRIALAAVAGRHPAGLEFGQFHGSVLFGPSYGQLNYWSPVLLYLARQQRRPIYQQLALEDESLGGLQRTRYRTPRRGEELLFSFGGYAYLWYDPSVSPAIEDNLPLAFEFPEAEVNEAYLRNSYRPGDLMVGMQKGSLVVHAGGRPVLVDMFNPDEVNHPSQAVEQMLVADDGRWARIRCVGPDLAGIGVQSVDLDRPRHLTIRRQVSRPLRWWLAGPVRHSGNSLLWPDGTRLEIRTGRVLRFDEQGFVETKVHYGGMAFADPQPQTYPTVEAEGSEGQLEIVITVPTRDTPPSP